MSCCSILGFWVRTLIAIRHRNHLAKDFFLAIEVDFEKNKLVGSRKRRWDDWDYACVCVCVCVVVADMCWIWREWDILCLIHPMTICAWLFFQTLSLISVCCSSLLEPEFECRIEPCSLLRERDSPNFLSTSFHRCCGIWSDPTSLWVFILWCTETSRVMVFVTSLFALVVLPRFARTSRRETAGFEEGGHSRCCTLRRGPGLSLLACG